MTRVLKLLGRTSSRSYQRSSTLAVLALFTGLYAVVIGTLDNWKLALVLLIFPAFLGVVALRDAPRILFSLLLVSLSFSARFRAPGYGFHPGGAELAIAPIDFPLFILGLLWLLQLLKRTRITKASVKPVWWSFILFLASHVLSVIPASNRGLALLELLRLLKMALLVLVISHYLDSRKKIVFAVNILLLTVILQGTLAVMQSAFHTSLGLDFLGEHPYWAISKEKITIGRAGGTLGHPNVLANFFEVLTPIALALVFSGTKGRLRLLAYGALLSGIIGTLLAFSRAGWISLALGLSLVAFQHRKRLLATRVVPALLATGLVVGLIALVFQGVIAARLTAFWEGSRLVRVVTAQTALNMVRSNPILGVGANNYLGVSNAYVEPDLTPGLSRIAAAVVHNVVLLYGAELGLLGLVSFLLLLLSLVRLARKIVRWSDPFLASLSAGTLAGIMALIAHSMWDWLFRYDPVYTLFWFSVGLLVAAMKILRNDPVRHQNIVR